MNSNLNKSKHTEIIITNNLEKQGTHWTKEDVEKLKSIAGYWSMEKMVKYFRRSPTAIRKKINRIYNTIDKKKLNDKVSTNYVSRILGTSKESVNRWIESKSLPATRRKNNSIQGFHYEIDFYEFFKWFEKNYKNLGIDFSSFNTSEFPYVMPMWLKDEISKQKNYKKDKKWTKTEEQILIMHYVKLGKEIKEVAEVLNRPYSSVNNKIKRMKLK